MGEASESLPVPFKGEPLEIGFNPEFFRDGLESAESEELILKLISPLRPGPDPVGRRRRLHLPRHADPAQRLAAGGRAACAFASARLPQLRGGRDRPAGGADGGAGPNGAGKTNLLEALYFGLTGRSCRTSNEREVVRLGEPVARVEVHVAAEDGTHALEVGLEPGEEKRVRVDGSAARRSRDRPPRPLVSVFLPDRLELVKGAPAGRRAHLDRFVAALWPARAETRAAYSRALAQRNALIGRVRAGAAAAELLDAWDWSSRVTVPS